MYLIIMFIPKKDLTSKVGDTSYINYKIDLPVVVFPHFIQNK